MRLTPSRPFAAGRVPWGLVVGLAACTASRGKDSSPVPVPDDEPARIEYGDAVVCADPTARDAAPIEAYDLGPEWEAAQPPDETPLATGDDIPPFGSVDAAQGITAADFTGDGVPEIWVPRYDGELLFVSQPDGTWVHEERLPANDAFNWAFGAVPGDIDGDADLDLLVSYLEGGTRVLLNDGAGWFSDGEPLVSAIGGPAPHSGGSLGDIDGDGDLDFAVSVLRNCDNPDGLGPHEVLWRNDDGVFVDISDALPPGILEDQFGRLASLIDMDDDGDLDLYVEADAFRQASTCHSGNALFYNDGGTWTMAPDSSGMNFIVEAMGLGLGDVNDDQLPDIAVSDSYELWLMESLGTGAWYNAAVASGIRFDSQDPPRIGAWAEELVDLDDDGDLDLPMVFGTVIEHPEVENPPGPEQTDAIWLRDGESYTEVAASWGWDDDLSAHAMVAVDLDGDGWLDLLRHRLRLAADVSRARCGAAHWLEIELRQPGLNVFGVGAVLDVETDAGSQRRWVHAGGTSYNGFTDALVHVGLGDATEAAISVRWPDGTTDTFTGVPVDRKVTLRRD